MNMKSNKVRIASGGTLAFATFLVLSGIAAAQNNHEKGVVNGRSGATMTIQTQDSGNVTVVLTPDTQVEEPEGAFRKKHLNMTALVPGLSVDVKGYLNMTRTNWSRTPSRFMAPTLRRLRTFKLA
jgi:hypothetical protein